MGSFRLDCPLAHEGRNIGFDRPGRGQCKHHLSQCLRRGDWASAPPRFEMLYGRYEKPLFDSIYRMVIDASETENLCQETFFRVESRE